MEGRPSLKIILKTIQVCLTRGIAFEERLKRLISSERLNSNLNVTMEKD